MATNTTTATTLPLLLPNSYLLIYTVPLLLLSIVATLGGAFLTLDRTRSFAPIDPPAMLTHKSKPFWRLEGGVGGVVAGFLCGLHLTTYFSILVLNRSKLNLSSVQFLIIWALSSALLTVTGSRWRIAASVFYALIGGSGITALLTIIFIPKSLLPRLIIALVLITAFLVCTMLPHPSIRHWSLRICASASGAVGVVISIALFTHAPSWSSPWLLFAIAPVMGTRDPQEKGLSAGMFLIMGLGIAVDWVLKIKLGEDPDKAWDEYLARYSKGMPYSSNRQGVFEPPRSLWSRLLAFGRRDETTSYHNPVAKDIVFPPDSQLLSSPKVLSKPDLFTLPSYTSTATAPPAFRPYPTKRQSTGRTNTLAKRSPKVGVVYSDDSSSDSSSDDEDGKLGAPLKFRPWLKQRQSSAATGATMTVVNSLRDDQNSTTTQGTLTPSLDKVLEYSDVEDDVVNAQRPDTTAHSPGWKPAFLRKHHEEETKRRKSLKQPGSVTTEIAATSSSGTGTSSPPRLTDSPIPISVQNTVSSNSRHSSIPITPSTTLSVPIGAVPATPSLIRAYNRITLAQEEAQRRLSTSHSTADQGGQSPAATSAPNMKVDLDERFWTRVRAKAAQYRHPDARVAPGEP
ncbi:hypothetical protein FRB93_002069 [Tulasnella sp. JGI-2019a]|nr:hypothetical protein FRB93_002069 [Tulasnella sp. JGI-2019a]